jgi:hypothetical protein
MENGKHGNKGQREVKDLPGNAAGFESHVCLLLSKIESAQRMLRAFPLFRRRSGLLPLRERMARPAFAGVFCEVLRERLGTTRAPPGSPALCGRGSLRAARSRPQNSRSISASAA